MCDIRGDAIFTETTIMMTSDTVQTLAFAPPRSGLRRLTRRQLLKRGLALGTGLIAGPGFIAGGGGAWALELEALSPDSMATLLQMARDIYPHDQFADELYAAAIKGHEDRAVTDADFKMMLEAGIQDMDARAEAAGHTRYLGAGWEADRVAILRDIEDQPFFQTIRGSLVVGLYNQPAVWELLGYEGSSVEHGGYLERGFDDIAWL